MTNYNQKCNTDPRKCKAQVRLYNLLKDPTLLNLMDAKKITHSEYNPKEFGGIGWMPMKTSGNSGAHIPLDRLNQKNDVINFLILKKYTERESKLISTALGGGTGIELATNANFAFDNQGNISVQDEDGLENVIVYNPIIPEGSRSKTDHDVVEEYDHTLESKYGAYTASNGNNVYIISNKITMSPNLRYILYTKDNTPSITSIYYLLYNPIHRKPFQIYYRSLLEYEGNWAPDGKLYDAGTSKGYQKNTVQALPSENGGAPKTAQSFKKIMGKYCNAIKIGGTNMNNGMEGEHYADPVCNLALSEQDAKIAFITGENRTQASLGYKFWANEGGDAADGKAGYKQALDIFSALPQDNTLFWPCENQRSGTASNPYNFLRVQANLIAKNSDSFINVLTNAYVNTPSLEATKTPVPLDVATNSGDTATCESRNISNVTCQNIVQAGIADGNKIQMQNKCGGGSRKPPPTTPPVTPAKPGDAPSNATPYVGQSGNNLTTGVGGTPDREDEDNLEDELDEALELDASLDLDAPLDEPKSDNTMLYIGLGAAFLIILVLIILLLL